MKTSWKKAKADLPGFAGMQLPAQTWNAIRADNIHTLGELTRRTELDLLKLPNLGRKGLDEIKKGLADLGLQLALPSTEEHIAVQLQLSDEIAELREELQVTHKGLRTLAERVVRAGIILSGPNWRAHVTAAEAEARDK